jgi:hypothetical protein
LCWRRSQKDGYKHPDEAVIGKLEKGEKKLFIVKTVAKRECQGKEKVKINIVIAPGSSNPSIDIKFNSTEIKIAKRRGSPELVGKRKRKRVRIVHHPEPVSKRKRKSASINNVM